MNSSQPQPINFISNAILFSVCGNFSVMTIGCIVMCMLPPACKKIVRKHISHTLYGVAGAPIVMFINIYAGESPIRKSCNFDKPLNHIFKVMEGCMHIFCLVSIKTHIIRMLELQQSPFFTNSLHEA